MLLERISEEEYTKHHKSTLAAGCNISEVTLVFSFSVPTVLDRGPLNFKSIGKISILREV